MVEFFVGDIAFLSALGFLAGIFAANLSVPVTIALLALAPGSFFFLRFAARRARRAACLAAAAIVLSFLFGDYYFHFFIAMRNAGERLPVGSGQFQILAAREPSVSEKYASFQAELQPPYSGTVTVFAPPGSNVRYGDLAVIAGAINLPRAAGELPAVFPKSIAVLSEGRGSWIVQKLLGIKSAINERFGEFLSRDEAALLGGMTLGGISGIGPELKQEMTASETLYVASMYGYKIAMIIGIVELVFVELIPRRARSILMAIFTVTFVLMSGGNISAVWGGIAAGMLILSRETGEIFSRRNGLALGAAGMALADPAILAGTGFSLTFLSVAGMAILVEPIRNFLRLGKGRGFLMWKEAVLFSAASLVPIIPIISASFGSFSATSVPANILIAPAIPFGMAFGALLAVAAFISRYAAFFIAHIVGAFLAYPLLVIRFFAAHVALIPFSFSGVLPFTVYYAAVALFARAYRRSGGDAALQASFGDP